MTRGKGKWEMEKETFAFHVIARLELSAKHEFSTEAILDANDFNLLESGQDCFVSSILFSLYNLSLAVTKKAEVRV